MRVWEEPLFFWQVSGELKVYTVGTLKQECRKKDGVPVVLHLYNTLFILQAKANLNLCNLVQPGAPYTCQYCHQAYT